MDVKVQKIRNAQGVELAYSFIKGKADLPTVVFFTGFRSDMSGLKAGFLSADCTTRQQSCLLFDYSGHGQSGGRLECGTIGQWLNDALTVIEELATGPLLLIGSSMGGWIALLAAQELKSRAAGLLTIAAAPDFTQDIQQGMTGKQRQDLLQFGFFLEPSSYGDELVITQEFLEDGAKHCCLGNALEFSGPVTLLHGKNDIVVPWQKSEVIKTALEQGGNKAVTAIYIEDGDHRLSRPQDLQLLKSQVESLSRKISGDW